MINVKKDLTKCLAKTKVGALGGGAFWRVYLWEDSESMILQSGIDGECRACHCPMFYRMDSHTGNKRSYPLIGEMHFVKDEWNIETVSHECCHGMFHYENSHTLKDAGEMTIEEQLCYLQGDLCLKTYRWLYKVNHFCGGIVPDHTRKFVGE